METIFDVLDKGLKGEPQLLFRITMASGSVLIGDDDPTKYSGFFPARKNMSVVIGFHEKHPGVISHNKNRSMEMSLSLLVRDTYYPTEQVMKVEIMNTKDDMFQLNELLKGLRKTITDTAKSLILDK